MKYWHLYDYKFVTNVCLPCHNWKNQTWYKNKNLKNVVLSSNSNEFNYETVFENFSLNRLVYKSKVPN